MARYSCEISVCPYFAGLSMVCSICAHFWLPRRDIILVYLIQMWFKKSYSNTPRTGAIIGGVRKICVFRPISLFISEKVRDKPRQLSLIGVTVTDRIVTLSMTFSDLEKLDPCSRTVWTTAIKFRTMTELRGGDLKDLPRAYHKRRNCKGQK